MDRDNLFKCQKHANHLPCLLGLHFEVSSRNLSLGLSYDDDADPPTSAPGTTDNSDDESSRDEIAMTPPISARKRRGTDVGSVSTKKSKVLRAQGLCH